MARFYPPADNNPQSATGTYLNPIFVWYPDKDDATTPASIDALYEYGGTRDTIFNRTMSFKLFPQPIGLGVASAGQSAVLSNWNRKQWYRTGQRDVIYYAFRKLLYRGYTLVNTFYKYPICVWNTPWLRC